MQYQPCPDLADFASLWPAFAGERDSQGNRSFIAAVWQHRQTCETCQANERYWDAWRAERNNKDTAQ